MQDRRRHHDRQGLDRPVREVLHDPAVGVHGQVGSVLLRPRPKRDHHDWRLRDGGRGLRPGEVTQVASLPLCLAGIGPGYEDGTCDHGTAREHGQAPVKGSR